MKEIDWKKEAQKNAAEAGELKISLAIRLDEDRLNLNHTVSQLLETEEADIAKALILKKSVLENEIYWLEDLIYGKCGYEKVVC